MSTSKLTVAQRAQLRANRRNNRLRRDLPLFADALQPGAAMGDWLTSTEQETVAIVEQQERTTAYFDQLRANEIAWQEQTAELRAVVIAGRPAEDIAFLDSRRAIYPLYGAYGLDFWRRVQTTPNWVEEERARLEDIKHRAAAWQESLAAKEQL